MLLLGSMRRGERERERKRKQFGFLLVVENMYDQLPLPTNMEEDCPGAHSYRFQGPAWEGARIRGSAKKRHAFLFNTALCALGFPLMVFEGTLFRVFFEPQTATRHLRSHYFEAHPLDQLGPGRPLAFSSGHPHRFHARRLRRPMPASFGEARSGSIPQAGHPLWRAGGLRGAHPAARVSGVSGPQLQLQNTWITLPLGPQKGNQPMSAQHRWVYPRGG